MAPNTRNTTAAGIAAAAATAATAVTGELADFTALLESFDLNTETILEIGRHGISSMEGLRTRKESTFTPFFTRIDKNPHPDRPAGASIWVTSEGNAGIRLAHTWVKRRNWVQLKYNAKFFTKKQQDLTTKRDSELADRLKSNEDNDVKAPLKFKSFSKWDEYIDSLDDYLDRVRGAADTQLSYITREESTVTMAVLGATYDTLDEFYVRCVAHTGTWYLTDNDRVWSEIKTSCFGTSAWERIKQYAKKKDGRNAYLKLMTEGETSNSKSIKKQKAYNIIADTVWQGPRQHWTFESYVGQFVKAYNDLERYDEPVGPEKQVRDFLKNISDPRLENARDIVFGSPTMLTDFVQCHQYMQTLLTNKTVLPGSANGPRKGGPRQIKGTGTGFTGKIEDKYYPPAEYRLFSREQKAQHKGLRVGTKKQRKAAAAKKRKAEEITEETDEESSAKKKTGVQFGSDAWKGKGQK